MSTAVVPTETIVIQDTDVLLKPTPKLGVCWVEIFRAEGMIVRTIPYNTALMPACVNGKSMYEIHYAFDGKHMRPKSIVVGLSTYEFLK